MQERRNSKPRNRKWDRKWDRKYDRKQREDSATTTSSERQASDVEPDIRFFFHQHRQRSRKDGYFR